MHIIRVHIHIYNIFIIVCVDAPVDIHKKTRELYVIYCMSSNVMRRLLENQEHIILLSFFLVNFTIRVGGHFRLSTARHNFPVLYRLLRLPADNERFPLSLVAHSCNVRISFFFSLKFSVMLLV